MKLYLKDNKLYTDMYGEPINQNDWVKFFSIIDDPFSLEGEHRYKEITGKIDYISFDSKFNGYFVFFTNLNVQFVSIYTIKCVVKLNKEESIIAALENL